MKNKIVIDFENIISELESKEVKLCFLKDRGIFIEDIQGNLYQMETYWHGSYLDKLIKDGVMVEFNLVDITKSKNIKDWEKEIWGVLEVKAFIKKTIGGLVMLKAKCIKSLDVDFEEYGTDFVKGNTYNAELVDGGYYINTENGSDAFISHEELRDNFRLDGIDLMAEAIRSHRERVFGSRNNN